MRGVFLHLLGDALGSVVVIIGALVVKYTTFSGRHYVDPALSLVLVVILMAGTIPVFRQAAMILLQTVPRNIDIGLMRREIRELPGILGAHELHVWSLADEKLVGSVHITCQNQQEYMTAARALKGYFHHRGVHSMTIQPELSAGPSDTESLDADENTCLLACEDDSCKANRCCPEPTSRSALSMSSSTALNPAAVAAGASQNILTRRTRSGSAVTSI